VRQFAKNGNGLEASSRANPDQYAMFTRRQPVSTVQALIMWQLIIMKDN
jgi:hypothetical protein